MFVELAYNIDEVITNAERTSASGAETGGRGSTDRVQGIIRGDANVDWAGTTGATTAIQRRSRTATPILPRQHFRRFLLLVLLGFRLDAATPGRTQTAVFVVVVVTVSSAMPVVRGLVAIDKITARAGRPWRHHGRWQSL